ncbi:MAG: hypothetical protein H8K04_05270 [Nitrospira sp.]
MGKYKTLAINFGIVVVVLGLIACVFEAVLKLTKFNVPANTRFVTGKGMTYIPHAYYRHTKEGFSEGYFNSHGFRDYERTINKPVGVFRILVLGDSYTEALQVKLEESFTALLEKALNEQASATRFEVLALGQSGFGTADEYLRYLNFGLHYDPDLVIVAFFTGNDFRNNSRFLNRETVGFYYQFDEKRELALDRSLVDSYEESLTPPKRVLNELIAKSHLLSLISERIYLLKRQLLQAGAADVNRGSGGDNRAKKLDLFSDLNIYQSDPTQQWKEAIEITEGVILKFRETVESNGSRFLLLGLSNAEQVHPQMGEELKNKYEVELDYEQPDRMLEEFAKAKGVMFLKLMPAFRDHHTRTGQYLHGFGSSHGGHWNQAGHRLAAELLLQFLKDQHLVPLKRTV